MSSSPSRLLRKRSKGAAINALTWVDQDLAASGFLTGMLLLRLIRPSATSRIVNSSTSRYSLSVESKPSDDSLPVVVMHISPSHLEGVFLYW